MLIGFRPFGATAKTRSIKALKPNIDGTTASGSAAHVDRLSTNGCSGQNPINLDTKSECSSSGRRNIEGSFANFHGKLIEGCP